MSSNGHSTTNMFKQIGPNEVTSSEGFSVKRSGRFELQYVEAGREISVEVESGDGLAVYTSAISHWKMSNGSEVEVSDGELEQIVDRISKGLTFLNIEHVIA